MELIVARNREDLVKARGGGEVALVPTMGALHEGHQALIRQARARADHVVVSIFVNPLQFSPNDDFSRYPRTFEADLDVCRAEGVDVVFHPAVEDMYAPDRQVGVTAGRMGSIVEGAARPGHFDGVLTVVLKLFNVVQPGLAVFGQKDAQQLALIRRMVADLDLPIEILDVPTVREPDGLALSSRNRFLSDDDRRVALALSRALRAGAAGLTPSRIRAEAREVLDAAGPELDVDYLVLVDPATFAEVDETYDGMAVLAVAARVGTTRLIDNVSVTLSRG
ncbi:pantoate--beta-alanine ligase [Nonomuraea sp. KC401]|uniref:pantoate--beta-alanine ligase n=1 Tax=unclassified Nonomuraea TaxID=2593643 RepID=UPI0010FD04F4|nr:MULTISPECIES: pantoate--beta-alanine ligase [unclassified Nonomuraea]NBE96380.1 pantoate--beta-alanine ligase [Nonomuraea sp. K271]TLF68079.1 pantoate--beta-alanine ligase [Nonomuraea sp. KC401]